MRFIHLLTYAVVLGFFAVICMKGSSSVSTAHLDHPRNAVFKNGLLDTDLLSATETEDSLADQLPQH